jgi:Domain of unknown function (DUF4340)
MNLRSTAWLFAVMLSMLWLFGLMLAFKKNPLDKAFVVPTLQAARDLDIVSVAIQRRAQGKDKDAQDFLFTQDNDVWRLKDTASGVAVKVEGFRINDIVNQVKNARKDDEADVTNNLAQFGLDAPQATVTIKGRTKTKAADVKDQEKDKDEKKEASAVKEREWKFYLGKESADKKYVYANSSDEPTRVFAVVKSTIDSLYFENPNHLRSKRLFDFSDATAQSIEIKQGGAELELKKGDDNLWRFVKPSLGFADFEGPPVPKELTAKEPPIPAKTTEGGVKGLLNAILNVRVDSDSDFVAAAKDNLTKYQLEDGKEAIRIRVGTSNFKKEVTKETLLVGAEERGYFYARLANDDGVFKLPAKLFEPVLSALKKPGELRNLDVAQFDPKTIDALTLRYGKDETKLWHPDGKPWQIQIAAEKQKKGGEKAIEKLIDTLQGKRQIQRFHDATEAEAKKVNAELGLDNPSLEITLYSGGLEKKDEKKDAKKDEKKDEKREEKKDTKPDDSFVLKKEAKPALTLRFGKADKETVAVERVTADGLVSRFTVPKSMLDAVSPPEGPLALLDPALPPFETFDVAKVELQRGTKKVELEKGAGKHAGRWLVKEGREESDQNLADVDRTAQLFRILGGLQAKKWLKPLDAKANLDDYGLKTPALSATVVLKKQRITPAGAASALAMLSAPVEARAFAAAGALAANLQAEKGETVTIQFGKETADKDVYAKHSGSDLLFAVPADLVKMLRELDLRDKTALLLTEHELGAGFVGSVAGQPFNGLVALTPVSTGQVVDLDPAKIKEIRIAVRNSFELRELSFQRKDKSWIDQSGLRDFNLDADKVEQIAKDFAQFKADRFVSLAGGPKADHKLGIKDFTAKVDLITDAGALVTITVGASLDRWGHFAHATSMPDAVFLVSASRIEPLLRGVGFFAKERTAAE